ncbi:MAG: hypothetical protein VKQ33_00175 [Candidatus Sericytochromatia bacterium]|nr:hypothetical protein [Candidatus Sericytochromatia bacterium]
MRPGLRAGGLVVLGLGLLAAAPALARPVHVPRPVDDRLEHHRPTRKPARPDAADGQASAAIAALPRALLSRARTLGPGTALLPATSPLRAWPVAAGGWLWLLQGSLSAGPSGQDGPRGGRAWGLTNWQQVSGVRALGPGLLALRSRTSLEPWTLPAGGLPQLFQTGGGTQAQPLVDRQAPQEALSELSARLTWPLSDHAGLVLYGGLVGEPALGPAAAWQRPSAADNAWAPLVPAVPDAARVCHGVVTAGLELGAWRLEGSAFNGREASGDLGGLRLRPLDAWAARLSWVPDPRWVLQASTARLRAPAPRLPGDVERSTASATVVQPVPGGLWATTALWGHQRAASAGTERRGLGLESQYDFGATHLYGRAEWGDVAGLPAVDATGGHRLGAFTVGLARDLDWSEAFDLAIGADATTCEVPADLASLYGEAPLSWRVYARLRPPGQRADPRPSP